MSRLSVLVLCCSFAHSVVAQTSATMPPATRERVHHTVQRSLAYLRAESAAWLNTRRCAACHHGPLPLWAMSEARQQGYSIDEKWFAETTDRFLGSKEKLLSTRVFPNPADPPDPRPQGRGLNMALPFLVVAARSITTLNDGQRQTLKLVEDEIVKKQQSDGSWEFFAGLRRPPINESQVTDMGWILLALEGTTSAPASAAARDSRAKGVHWLSQTKPSDNIQEWCWRLLLATHAKEPKQVVDPMIRDLVSLQRADGGWSQSIPAPKSDAHATGQVLYALSQTGLTWERPEVMRGIDFLCSTQSKDGSWPMASRPSPDGSPGASKLLTPITCAASSWATLGLVRLAPARP